MNIPFNKPNTSFFSKVAENIESMNKFSGDGNYTKQCSELLVKLMNVKRSLLTTSCTHSLEMAAILINTKPGDEVIMPSFTFVSTANAFVMRGAKIKFIDVDPGSMNMNERLVEPAITDKTIAIVPVHYGGSSCDMIFLKDLADSKKIFLVEDAAQSLMSKYSGKSLGSFGQLSCTSFHETKNYNSGEGGSLQLTCESLFERAEIIREKGTNRSKFFRGQVDKYTWVDVGSSYLMSEINAMILSDQLQNAEVVNNDRLRSWSSYQKKLTPLVNSEKIQIQVIPVNVEHNGHLFFIKCSSLFERSELINFLAARGVGCAFHYVPLHSSPAGLKHGVFHGKDNFTTSGSEVLVRLPMYYGLFEEEIDYVCSCIFDFFRK